MSALIQQTILVIFIYFLGFFTIGTLIKNNSIVDIGWGLGFVVVSWFTTLRSGNFYLANIILTLLITIWGLRLFYHIIKRNIGKPEDFRYANWRKEWGKLVEANEAFSAQSLAVLNDLKIKPEVVNVNGGAIALGHPVGASGARILTTLLYEMKRRDTKTGLATLCIGGGMGTAIIVKR